MSSTGILPVSLESQARSLCHFMHVKRPSIKALAAPVAMIALAATMPMVLATEAAGAVSPSRMAMRASSDQAGSIVRCVNEAARQFCKPQVVWADTTMTAFVADELRLAATVVTQNNSCHFSSFLQPSLIDLPPPAL